uniref:Hypothetical secreted peptide 1122 n=1 Tax=Amblyomma variegatum TaxID=34610 RepID=F0J9S8_AMBVA|nr:TPA_inf: hypothetical secreted peptide precursor 1122 [Amblyomma variegatum]
MAYAVAHASLCAFYARAGLARLIQDSYDYHLTVATNGLGEKVVLRPPSYSR